MGSFFLLNSAIDIENLQEFVAGMLRLGVIDKHGDDVFFKNQSVYNIGHYENLFSHYGQEEQFITEFIEKLTPNENNIESELELDQYCDGDLGAFLGIQFAGLDVSASKQVVDNNSYKALKNSDLWDVDSRTLFEKSGELFPNLVLCGEVEHQLNHLGDGSYFNQILDRLKELNKAAGDWTNNNFSHRIINQNYSLNISPESQQTMDNHGAERLFSLPNGERKHFELHIKTGDFRFHFYPDSTNYTIYVGYIGPHLTTWTN
jgi:hypothetical protein